MGHGQASRHREGQATRGQGPGRSPPVPPLPEPPPVWAGQLRGRTCSNYRLRFGVNSYLRQRWGSGLLPNALPPAGLLGSRGWGGPALQPFSGRGGSHTAAPVLGANSPDCFGLSTAPNTWAPLRRTNQSLPEGGWAPGWGTRQGMGLASACPPSSQETNPLGNQTSETQHPLRGSSLPLRAPGPGGLRSPRPWLPPSTPHTPCPLSSGKSCRIHGLPAFQTILGVGTGLPGCWAGWQLPALPQMGSAPHLPRLTVFHR